MSETGRMVASASSRLRVAVCEQDTALDALLREWLAQGGYEPVSRAGEDSEPPAVVVADMPALRSDAVRKVQSLRQRYPGARILALSGQLLGHFAGGSAAAALIGADCLLAKPGTCAAFLEAMRLLTIE